MSTTPGCQVCKEIIDNRSAIVRQLDCMSTSIMLNAEHGNRPTQAMADEFRSKADELAKTAARIEAHVSSTPNRSPGFAGTSDPKGGAT